MVYGLEFRGLGPAVGVELNRKHKPKTLRPKP